MLRETYPSLWRIGPSPRTRIWKSSTSTRARWPRGDGWSFGPCHDARKVLAGSTCKLPISSTTWGKGRSEERGREAEQVSDDDSEGRRTSMMRFHSAQGRARAHGLPGQLWKSLPGAGIFALLLSMPSFSQAGSPAVSCEGLAKLTLPNATITMVQRVAAGELKDCLADRLRAARVDLPPQPRRVGRPVDGQGLTLAASRQFAGFRPRYGPATKTRSSLRCGCRPGAGTGL